MSDASYHAAVRLLREQADRALSENDGPTLEATTRDAEPARLVDAQVIEDSGLRVRPVTDPPVVEFGAFLDGVQRSRVAAYRNGIPVVHGLVGAAIRVRKDRRLVTWSSPLLRARLYAPRAYLDPAEWRRAAAGAFDVIDTTIPDGQGRLPIPHPHELLVRAVHAVQEHREAIETELAEQWCATEEQPLYVDGGIASGDRLARSPFAVGVIKSHRSLYASPSELPAILALPERSRTSVFLRTSARRPTVASWYLRLRDTDGRDPLFGLVRVEVAMPETAGSGRAEAAALTERADLVSRWILAELTPLALPDPRWHAMVYGVRDVEQYLRALSA